MRELIMENRNNIEIKKPARRLQSLEKDGFFVVTLKFSNRIHDKSVTEISKIIWSLKPIGTELIVTAVNEFSAPKESMKEIARQGDEVFYKILSEKNLEVILLNWKAENHVISFFRQDDFEKKFPMIADAKKRKTSFIGFEEEYLIGFGPERITIFISDSHDSIEIWGSKPILEEAVDKIKL
jgi:hypothetical protein